MWIRLDEIGQQIELHHYQNYTDDDVWQVNITSVAPIYRTMPPRERITIIYTDDTIYEYEEFSDEPMLYGKRSKLDDEYPHKCEKCGKSLWYNEFLQAEKWRCEIKTLEELWKNEEIRLYCCSCKHEEEMKNIIKKINVNYIGGKNIEEMCRTS